MTQRSPIPCLECGKPVPQKTHGGQARKACPGECTRAHRQRQRRELAGRRGRPQRRPSDRTVDAEHTRCPDCQQVKPNSQFGVDKGRWDHLTYRCLVCASAYKKAHARYDPVRATASKRRNQLKKYNLTPDQYEEMRVAQASGCRICGQVVERLHVDHDHTTGVVRGLLCQPCNFGLGNFRDRPELLTAAIRYLEDS